VAAGGSKVQPTASAYPDRLASAAAVYYVAVGASESVGVQPGNGGKGYRTDRGYANDLTAMEKSRFPGLRLIALGCPGITSVAALNGRGPCLYSAGSEVRQAEAFIHRHRASTVLASVDLGFNDLRPCLRAEHVNPSCVVATLTRVGRIVPEVIRGLQTAGDSDLRIVGVEHNDPYLGDYLRGARGRAFAAATLGVVDALNATLHRAYTAAGIVTADVPALFASGDNAMVTLPGHNQVPADVAAMCRLSWMCNPPPYGNNIHPNSRGYQTIADALAEALNPPAGAPQGAPDTEVSLRGFDFSRSGRWTDL
jgi:lysophospholipase L1-like esterase